MLLTLMILMIKLNYNYYTIYFQNVLFLDSSIACDFEDPYFCGYRFNKSWKVTNGRKEGTPRLDHSQGTYYGELNV